MQEVYGILGSSNLIEPSTIVASLGDITNKVLYIVPWYGNKKVSSSMEVVYDWLLDNNATFKLVMNEEGRTPPNVLMTKANEVVSDTDVETRIICELTEREVKGIALLVWDEEHPERSIDLASACINKEVPSLELTNGLSPIIIDDEGINVPIADEDLPSVGEMSFDEETLQVMPAASVKRMARDAGHDVKTKEEAIKILVGSNKNEEEIHDDGEIGTIIVLFKNGIELGFKADNEILTKMFNMVVKHSTD